MFPDKRLLRYLQHGLLSFALAAPLLTGCGEDAPSTDNDEDTVEPGDGDEDPEDTGGKKDGGTGTTPPKGNPKPGTTGDGGTGKPGTTTGDGGTGKPGTTTGGLDGGGTTPTDPGQPGPQTGDAPTEASVSKMGTYAVKTYTSGYAEAPEYLDATMHYPDAAGTFPAIAIVPGFLSAQATIQKWGPFLASHGIITFTIGTNSPADQPDARATALWGAIGTIKSENARADSPIKGKVDLSRLAVGGWSMGGGGVLLATSAHPELKAGIAFCPWSPGATFPKITTPILFLAALNDQLAKGQSQPFYDSIPASTPKMLWEKSDADHFANDPDQEMYAQGRYGLSWLKVYLAGDDRYKQFLLVKPPNASDFKTNVK
jgi:dienelactone hydrolase